MHQTAIPNKEAFLKSVEDNLFPKLVQGLTDLEPAMDGLRVHAVVVLLPVNKEGETHIPDCQAVTTTGDTVMAMQMAYQIIGIMLQQYNESLLQAMMTPPKELQ